MLGSRIGGSGDSKRKSSLLVDFVEPVRGKNEMFKKSLATMDKQHRRGYRKRRTEMKKKVVEEQKLRKKLERQEPVGGALETCRRQVAELHQGLESQEREAVERVSQLERQQFLCVARALQPVLEQQAVLACKHLPSSSSTSSSSSTNLSDLITSLAEMAEQRKSPTAELDSMIRDLRSASTGYSFTTPPPSPATSLQGSRRGSISSIGSASSLQRPVALSNAASSPSPQLPRPRPTLQRSLSHASDRERSRRLSGFSLRSETAANQPDFHSEEFERSLEGHSRPSRPRSVTRPPFSTVRRASSPFRPPPADRQDVQTPSKKPPVWRGGNGEPSFPTIRRDASSQQRERGRGLDRPPVPPRSSSIDRMHRIGRDSPEPELYHTLGRDGRDGGTLERLATEEQERLTLGRNGRDQSFVDEFSKVGEVDVEAGERSSSSSDASSGFCGSQDLLTARADVHSEPREASLPRRPTSSLSSFAPATNLFSANSNSFSANGNGPTNISTTARSNISPPRHHNEAPPRIQPLTPGSTCTRIPLQVLQGPYQNNGFLPDPPNFVDDYIERISAAQHVLRAFPPTAQSQGVIVPTKVQPRTSMH